MFKPGGAPMDLYRENLITNMGTYGAGLTDDYQYNSTISGTPARQAHATVAPYTANPPVTDNWQEHIRGKKGQTSDPSAIYQQ